MATQKSNIFFRSLLTSDMFPNGVAVARFIIHGSVWGQTPRGIMVDTTEGGMLNTAAPLFAQTLALLMERP